MSHPAPPAAPAADTVGLTPEEQADLQDAIDQDKELRWLERDASLAERALLDAPAGTRGEELRRLHKSHHDAQQRLGAAHAAILAWLEPQFAKRRQARLGGGETVVFTREEFRVLSLDERTRLDQPGRDQVRVSQELKQRTREILAGRGWHPRERTIAAGGRAPRLAASAWRVRGRLDELFAGRTGPTATR
jgi:hypothetical protein